MNKGDIFKGKVHDFLDIMRIISYPLSDSVKAKNTALYDVLIYVEDWSGSFNGADEHWMYITSNNKVGDINKWMKNKGYTPYTKERVITKYVILESSTASVVVERTIH